MTESPQPVALSEICAMDALALARAIRSKTITARDAMEAYLAHIRMLNPVYNAIVSLRPEAELLIEAEEADRAVRRGDPVSPLHGIPIAIKDLALTRGLRTTFGSRLFADYVPASDAIFVERIRAAGAIIIGKTNVPEFGFGSNSYNAIFGLTRNAYNPDVIGGGSSGGAGVALALRMLPIADGGDTGGSLRNPAAFNNVFGFRPSQGRVPADILDPFYSQLAVEGPMGRTVADVAALLSVQSGYDPRSPLSLDDAGYRFEDRLSVDLSGKRFGWLGDYDGHLAFETGVLELCRTAAGLFEKLGATVEPASLGFDPERLWRAFKVLRQHGIGGRLDDAYRDPAKRDLLKPEAIWEIEQSRRLTSLDFYNASVDRGA
jgi:amidase